MVSHEGDGIECLPPGTFGILCTRLLVDDVESDLSVLADFFLGTRHREYTLEVINNVLIGETLRTKVSSHFLVGLELFFGDAKSFLDSITIELVAVRYLDNLAGVLRERQSQCVIAHNADWSEPNID